MPKAGFTIARAALFIAVATIAVFADDYPIVETGQEHCYNNSYQIPWPSEDGPFYGQDAQYDGNQPLYSDNRDGTITDLVTGLMWQQTPDLENKSTFAEALAGADSFSLGGYNDWRLPTIKELYSLIDFRGHTGMNAETSIPYIDTAYFDFCYGNEDAGERFIDAQYWSATQYVGTVFHDIMAVFGVNFADGRIKGYPRDIGPGGRLMTEFVRYVRENTSYGINDFADNGDGTITDYSTGLMWQKSDDGVARNWEDALAYAESLNLAGHDDWRLPNAKELESLVNYNQSPDASELSQIGPAIDPLFEITNIGTEQEPEYGFYWANTTHSDGPDDSYAAYVSFGRGLGWMEEPPGSGNYVLQNVHGAGCQRSDPKSGNPDNYPHGHGPQGDVIRIYNMVRCVRGGLTTDIDEGDGQSELPNKPGYLRNYPNPFNGSTTISYSLPFPAAASIRIYDILGRMICMIDLGEQTAGNYQMSWKSEEIPSGTYFCEIRAGSYKRTMKMLLLK